MTEQLVDRTETLEITTETATEVIKVEAPTQVLITEAEVRFNTAVALRPAKVGWFARFLQVFAANPEAAHRPKRLRYVEDARMGRAMDRL